MSAQLGLTTVIRTATILWAPTRAAAIQVTPSIQTGARVMILMNVPLPIMAVNIGVSTPVGRIDVYATQDTGLMLMEGLAMTSTNALWGQTIVSRSATTLWALSSAPAGQDQPWTTMATLVMISTSVLTQTSTTADRSVSTLMAPITVHVIQATH